MPKRIDLLVAALVAALANAAAAEPIQIRAAGIEWRVDPATVEVQAAPDGAKSFVVMPPLHKPEPATVVHSDGAWRWADAQGRTIAVSAQSGALRVRIAAAPGARIDWALPPASEGDWLVPDGEGMAYGVNDPFWRAAYAREHCLGGTSLLSFPAWSLLTPSRAVTYALDDGFQSQLCLHDSAGLQARLSHQFEEGAEAIDLRLAVGPPDPLAPAIFYRKLLSEQGRLRRFSDKAVPGLSRLYGAPHAYVWGDGRDIGLLDDLGRLKIDRMVLSYDQDVRSHEHLVRPAWLKRANAMGYLAGPYEAFDNGQPAESADTTTAIWSDQLYPAGCIHTPEGKVVPGFGGRGCEMSSEAIARNAGPTGPSSRYASHAAEGASQVFVDVDAFGAFYADSSPAHPMTKAKDRANRLARLGLVTDRFHLVLGSENVTAWSSVVAHYSHGTAQAHASAIWPLLSDPARFGGWWPDERPSIFFKPLEPTGDETRALFGPGDRLPLFEAVFHDSVVALDRWEFSLMKVKGQERRRFARSLLYGVPTMWNLDRRELARVGPWLKAAEQDFLLAHGRGEPLPLTRFRWLTPDRLVQEASYADGRVLTGNFGLLPWRGLEPDCVRLARGTDRPIDLCPPPQVPLEQPGPAGQADQQAPLP